MRARITVENAERSHALRFVDHTARIILRVARVNDERERGFGGELDLCGKRAELCIARRVVVMVV